MPIWTGPIANVMGPPGPAGPQGPQGAPGKDGSGVPAGGTIGELLVKNSATDGDVGWTNTPAINNISGLTPAGLLSIGADGKLYSRLNYAFCFTGPFSTTVTGIWVSAGATTAILTPRTSGTILLITVAGVYHSASNAGIAFSSSYGPMPFQAAGSNALENGWAGAGEWDPVTIGSAGWSASIANMFMINLQTGTQYGFTGALYNGTAGTATVVAYQIFAMEL